MSLNTLHIEAAKVTHDLSVDKPPHPNSRGCHQNAAIMGLNDLHTVDAIGLERESGAAVLTLIDSWDWRDEKNHLDALQSKLNAYFNFIESGQIGETHPQAVGRKLFIEVVTQRALSDKAKLLLKHVSDFAAERNVGLRCKQVKGIG